LVVVGRVGCGDRYQANQDGENEGRKFRFHFIGLMREYWPPPCS
jgi:hypothetical protein